MALQPLSKNPAHERRIFRQSAFRRGARFIIFSSRKTFAINDLRQSSIFFLRRGF
jgi:hypothetical protein